jgi:hypothetical protein
MLERIRRFLSNLDPKLVGTVAGTLGALAVTSLGFDVEGYIIPEYLTWKVGIALGVGALTGWIWPNAGSALRKAAKNADVVPADSGGLVMPPGGVSGQADNVDERGELNLITIGALCGIAAFVLVLVILL